MLQAKYANQDLLLLADLSGGEWRKLQKTYGYFSQTRIPYKRGWSIRSQLSVLAQPATFDEEASKFPNGELGLASKQAAIRYLLSEGHLEIRVSLNADQPWRIMTTHRPGLFVHEMRWYSISSTIRYELMLWLVFHEPGPAKPRDVKEWGQRFFLPAGQVESNRRKH